MFLHRSSPSMCDSKSPSYFDRPHAQISRYRSEDSQSTSIPSSTMMTRKRPRIDSQHYHDSHTPRASSTGLDLDASFSSLGVASPSPLANSDYRLFGGLDTPGTWSEMREERVRIEDAERDYRPSRYNQTSHPSFAANATALMKSEPHAGATPSSLTGWHLRRTAWALTGGLAGKIFNFCWNTTFRGFQAGEGPAYLVPQNGPTDFAQDGDSNHRARSGTAQYSEEIFSNNQDYFGRSQSRHLDHNSYQRPIRTPVSYKRQISEDSVVKNNWVFVETTATSPDEQTPLQKRSRASIAGSGSNMGVHQTYQVQSHIPQPAHTSRTHTASFASPRCRTSSTATAVVQRTYSYNSAATNNNVHSRPISPITTPKSKRQRVSGAVISPVRRQSSYLASAQQLHSPVSPEIETYHRKMRREEKRQDQSLKRLNSTLQDMIREGQAALGSKIEIVDADEFGMDVSDEGYFGEEMR